jgi:hypothetical protein
MKLHYVSSCIILQEKKFWRFARKLPQHFWLFLPVYSTQFNISKISIVFWKNVRSLDHCFILDFFFYWRAFGFTQQQYAGVAVSGGDDHLKLVAEKTKSTVDIQCSVISVDQDLDCPNGNCILFIKEKPQMVHSYCIKQGYYLC